LAAVGAASLVSVTSSKVLQVPLTMVQRNTAGVPVGTPVTVDVAEPGVVIVAMPLIKVHVPVPTDGVLPARVKLALLHCAWSGPATAVCAASLVKVTSSKLLQVPLTMVQRNTAGVPVGTPVTVDVEEPGVVIVAVPLIKVHVPTPTDGVLPAKVKLVLLHWAWSGPALATVGAASLVRDTSSILLQVPLTMVQRNTAVLPVSTPVTVDVAEFGLVIVAVPLIKVHVPTPTDGVLPAKVKLELLHCAWSGPAFAAVGAASLVSVTSSNVLQVPLTMVQRNTAGVPVGTPVTVDVSEFGLVIVAVPLIKVHVPTPTDAALPAKVKVVLLH